MVRKAKEGDSQFTAREVETMAVAWTCFKTVPDIDIDKLAEKLGMTNPRSATNAVANIKKKIFSDGVTISTPKKAAGGKKRKAAEDENDDGEDEKLTPSPKKAKSVLRKTKSPAKVEEEESDESDAKDGDVKDEDFKDEEGSEDA
ncbi:MAG: hypothetical protein M1820_008797 [Bogoriella megaspora]|nr:MAG: hypothetical protein M1820_008797 [Bogoriella megaspora]